MTRAISILVLASAVLPAQNRFAASGPQIPRIDVLEIYGHRKVSESKIRQVLKVKEGDPLPPSKGDVEERLNDIDGVVESHLEAVCCDDGKVILYVGIEERGATHFDIRDTPEGDATLPEEITATYRRLMEAAEIAARRGSTEEDLTRGHSLLADREARAIQDMLPALADSHLVELRHVLRDAFEESQRAAAAYIIGYANKKNEIVNDLQYALRDADPGVRANAAHGLAALAVLERLKPDSGVHVSATWFIEMLNSLSFSDRNKAVWALQILTDKRDAPVLTQLRDRAMPALAEMARWKSLPHALPAFVLVGRIAGLTEEQIQDTWSRGDREKVIASALKSKP
jgi:hypothetical protein